MGKTKTGKLAVACTAIAFVFVLIAFTTPNWFQTDGTLENPKFIKTGLWTVCLQSFEHPKFYYDVVFNDCSWIYAEENYIIQDILLPDFLIVTEFFFTICLVLLLIGSFSTLFYCCCTRYHDKYQFLLWAIGCNLSFGGLFGVIAVIAFVAKGDWRDWMPDWEHNDLGWSYILAVLGSLISIVAGILFLVEGRRHRKKQERKLGDEMKTHTTI